MTDEFGLPAVPRAAACAMRAGVPALMGDLGQWAPVSVSEGGALGISALTQSYNRNVISLFLNPFDYFLLYRTKAIRSKRSEM